MKPLCITCAPGELEQGLFGQAFYYIMQILPYLEEQGIFPAWHLRTEHYGGPPDFLTIPGAVDLVYEPPPGPYRTLSLFEMRRRHSHVLGDDWAGLHRMWNAYFSIPQRVLLQADAVFPEGRVLGVHYRGTDKQSAAWDSNPITQDEYIALIRDFLEGRPEFDRIVAATDEHSFVDRLRSSIDLPVIALGQVDFHLATENHTVTRGEKTDRAMLDCVLLSRCVCLIETSSALPSFAKLLNPALEIYRCAASKLFGKLYTKMPYFPVAHVPLLPVTRDESKAILERTMKEDWTFAPETRMYRESFTAKPRWPINHAVFGAAEKLSLDKPLARVFNGFR